MDAYLTGKYHAHEENEQTGLASTISKHLSQNCVSVGLNEPNNGYIM